MSHSHCLKQVFQSHLFRLIDTIFDNGLTFQQYDKPQIVEWGVGIAIR